MSTQEKYNAVSMLIHWVMALFIILLFCLGWYMVDLPKGSDERTFFFGLHKSIGLTMALLAVIRLIWRFTHQPPALPETVTAFKRRLAAIVHWLLYLTLFIQPVSGYISSSFSGYKTKFWGVPLPHWGWKSQPLNEFFTEIHEISAVVLFCLIVLHICGVIAHIIEGDKALLRRMMPGKG